ncbi:putative Baseplate assembly protein W [uncultured Alphaproteobacteria bacterium]|uniref:Putative Baseplate assembly protein W n=1 Tax=uncultured Alphaproteobacteria bacterium TaxID=91750 RepID=A0A212KBR9_9PROT|nr:putative Baseplate assembly protein W [uncultured Alphaproteobacteria bacterium]
MQGMDGVTGKRLGGVEHLRQSVVKILTTRIGTRGRRRVFGSNLPNRIDNPAGPGLAVDVIADTAAALAKWEPRYALKRVVVDQATPGRCVLDLDGVYLPEGRRVTLDGIVIE